MMTEEELQQIRERAEQATSGPWTAKREQAASGIFAPSEVTKLSMHGKARIAFTGGLVIRNHEADAAFIAHAREDIPALLAEVERLQRRVQALQDEITMSHERLAPTMQTYDRMREIVQFVAGCDIGPHSRRLLMWQYDDADVYVTKARQLLNEQSKTYSK